MPVDRRAALDDPTGARRLLAEVAATILTDEERFMLSDDLAIADDLTHPL